MTSPIFPLKFDKSRWSRDFKRRFTSFTHSWLTMTTIFLGATAGYFIGKEPWWMFWLLVTLTLIFTFQGIGIADSRLEKRLKALEKLREY